MVHELRAKVRVEVVSTAAVCALTALTARTAHACSGPGAGDAMALSFRVALGTLVGMVIASVLVFATARLRPTTLRWRAFWLGLPLLQMVAVMLLGTARGDCGYTLRSFSFGMLGIFGLATIAGIVVRSTTSRAT